MPELTLTTEQLRTLVDGSRDAIFWINAEGRYLYVSPAITALSGHAPEELIADPRLFRRLIHPDDQQTFSTHIDHFAAPEHEQIDLRIITRSGETRWITHYCKPVFDPVTGEQVGRISQNRDITKRKTVELQLRKAIDKARQFNSALDHVGAFVFIRDRSFRFAYANLITLEFFGCPMQKLLGALDTHFFPPETIRQLRELDQRVLAGEDASGEITVDLPNGERNIYWVIQSPVLLSDNTKDVSGMIGIATDITRQKQLQETLAFISHRTQVQAELPKIAETLSEAEFLQYGVDQARMLTGSTGAFLSLVPDDAETIELVAWSPRTFIDPSQASPNRHALVKCVGTGACSEALRQKRPCIINDCAHAEPTDELPGGPCRYQRLAIFPVIEQGRIFMLVGVVDKATPYTEQDIETLDVIATDIWQIIQRQRAKQKLADNFAYQQELNRKLEETQGQLLQSEKLASIGQLAAGVAHEINNPIGFINSNFGTLEDYLRDLFEIIDAYGEIESGGMATPQRERIAALKRAKDLDFLRTDIVQLMAESKEGLDRVAHIVRDLKDFSRVGEVEWQAADLHAGIDSTLNIIANELKYKCTITRDYGSLPPVWCVPPQLNQVFMNLLVNAGHAIQDKGEITIRTGTQDGKVFVSIADTGIGIPPENLDRIFDPFFTTKPVGSGTGLGLSLVYGIVQKHHGHIDVQSEPGQGATFTVWLPIRPHDAADAVLPALTVGDGGEADKP